MLAFGCQPTSSTAKAPSDSESMPIPNEQRPSVSRAQRLGRMLFEHDSVGARATDAVHRRVHTLDSRVRGWLTLRSGDTWTVPFLTDDDGAVGVLYRVQFRGSIDSSPEVQVLDSPEPVDDTVIRMFSARETAKKQAVQFCSKTYNTVVLPATEFGQDGWLVYLLAATTDPEVMVSGGHHRFVISPDGRTVIERFQFTKACLTMPVPRVGAGEKVAGAMVTHLTSQTPTEAHVFLSLLHHVPIYVGVVEPRALWEVKGSRIELIATKE
jgi:hypothetical protein